MKKVNIEEIRIKGMRIQKIINDIVNENNFSDYDYEPKKPYIFRYKSSYKYK